MPRLEDTRTGVVVDVDDVTAATLGAAYKPADESKASGRKPASSKSDK